ncbi:MAG: hypothetical protein GVY13_08750 [Alphaproteobacteria bacterium]|jgi:hypothetical protein|nr:hypothetical protein [Alphaproteobacteria bacterium]
MIESCRRDCRPAVRLFLLLGALAVSNQAGAQADRYYQFANTRSYLAASDTMRTGYVAGLMDAALAYGALPDATASCLAVMRLREIRSGFDRWLRNHPAEWRFSLPSNFTIAMRGVCE